MQRKVDRRMLTWLADYSDTFQIFNVFRYITFRTGGALMTAALFMFIAGSPIIDWLRAAQGRGQPIREDGPQSHLKRQPSSRDHYHGAEQPAVQSQQYVLGRGKVYLL